MSYIGKEDISAIVPRVLSIIRASPSVRVFGRFLEVFCGIQDINFLEEKGFLFIYDKQFGFSCDRSSFVLLIDLNYWTDMFLRFQSNSYKSFLPKDYRKRVKKSYELRTPFVDSESQV